MASPRQSLTFSSDGAVSGGAGGKALGLAPTQAVILKVAASVALGALTLYFLHTGRRDSDAGRLFWAAVLGLATFLLWL